MMGIAALFAAMPAHAALDPAKPIEQHTQRVWESDAALPQSGLPQNSVLAIAQGSEGYLWIGTEAGLARFDGVRFRAFTSENTPELHSEAIRALLVDSHNNLWIGTYGGGLVLYRDEKFLTFPAYEKLSANVIHAFYEDGNGTLWICSDNGGLIR
ncbi:MAG: hypothetical protein JOZ62_11940, partial [Acidobacteriaceae bacterium]|nr:hypothetical protein [Acidobacteriaceae bacterium]